MSMSLKPTNEEAPKMDSSHSRDVSLESTREGLARNNSLTGHKRHQRHSILGNKKTYLEIIQEDTVRCSQEEINEIFRQRRKYAIISCLVGFVGLMLSVLQNELMYEEYSNDLILAVNVINLGVTACTILMVYQYALMVFNHTKAMGVIGQHETLWTEEPYWQGFLQECCMCIIVPLPGLENVTVELPAAHHVTLTYKLNSVLTFFCFIRFYLVMRVILETTFKMEMDTALLRLYQVENKISFAVKTLVDNNPVNVVSVVIFLNLFVSGYLLRIAEIPPSRNDTDDSDYGCGNAFACDEETYWDSVWLIVTTMSTIGFGDVFPSTYWGRACITLSFLGGNISLAIMIAVITGFLQFTGAQHKVIEMKQVAMFKKNIKLNGARVLCYAFRLNVLRKKLERMVNPSGIPGDRIDSFSLTGQDAALYTSVSDKAVNMYETLLRTLAKSRECRSAYRRYLIQMSSGHTLTHHMLVLLLRDASKIGDVVRLLEGDTQKQKRLTAKTQNDNPSRVESRAHSRTSKIHPLPSNAEAPLPNSIPSPKKTTHKTLVEDLDEGLNDTPNRLLTPTNVRITTSDLDLLGTTNERQDVGRSELKAVEQRLRSLEDTLVNIVTELKELRYSTTLPKNDSASCI